MLLFVMYTCIRITANQHQHTWECLYAKQLCVQESDREIDLASNWQDIFIGPQGVGPTSCHIKLILFRLCQYLALEGSSLVPLSSLLCHFTLTLTESLNANRQGNE